MAETKNCIHSDSLYSVSKKSTSKKFSKIHYIILTQEIVNQATEILGGSDTSANPRYKHWVLQTFSIMHIGETTNLLLKKVKNPLR